MAVVAGASLALAGCGNENEKEAERLQKNLGAVPETTVKGDATPRPPSVYGKRETTNSEYESSVKGKAASPKK